MERVMNLIQEEVEYRKRCLEAFQIYSYGNKNKHKKFRILCNRERWAKAQGLISTIFVILPNIIEAREHGYIPVVDLRMNSRCSVSLQEQRLCKKENAWEYYFTQPDIDYSLEVVHQSRHVEKQMKSCINLKYYIGDGCLRWDEYNTQKISLALRQNIHLQQVIKDRVICEKQNLFPKTNKILGVGIRAGYRRGILKNVPLFNGHPVVGSCADFIRGIEKRLSKWNYDSFFLEVDDREYLEAIKKYFGNSCIYLERPRAHYFKNAMNDIPYNIDDVNNLIEFDGISVRQKNEDYLVELYLLAQCDALYASRGTGHNFSYLLNRGRYSYVEFIDSGEFRYIK